MLGNVLNTDELNGMICFKYEVMCLETIGTLYKTWRWECHGFPYFSLKTPVVSSFLLSKTNVIIINMRVSIIFTLG